MTFLWRAEGCPEPETLEHPFDDLDENAYYFKAVLWAYQNGVTTGVTKTSFGPGAECTRAQVMTFLWRAEGSLKPQGSTSPFTDVSLKSYYGKAVLWAYEQGIAAGTTPTSFGPKQICTRAQAVTFLFRAEGGE